MQERCDIADFMVDGNDTLVSGTLNSNHAYVYHRLYDLNTIENGDNVLVKSKGKLHSYSLEGGQEERQEAAVVGCVENVTEFCVETAQ